MSLLILLLSAMVSETEVGPPFIQEPAPVLSDADVALPEVGSDSTVSRSGSEDSIGSLFKGEPDERESPGTGTSTSIGAVFFKMLGWVAALGVLALVGVRIWRRIALPRLAGAEGKELRVVGRTALTPRHFLYMVRVANSRLLVVGVSGDRISPVSEFTDPAQVVALDSTFRTDLGEAGAPSELVEEVKKADPGRDILPYRTEVNRLRGLVRGWRSRLHRSPGQGSSSEPM